MDESLLRQLDHWHDIDEHQKIVEAIEAIPEPQRDYELICRLGRALNNLSRYEEALDQLLLVEKEGEKDPLWHFRVGYALFYMEKEEQAKEEFETVLEMAPEDESAKLMLGWCEEDLTRKELLANQEDLELDPELYSEEELDAVENHIQRHFGPFDQVFHEIVSPDIHVDIAIVKPTPQRNYYVLVTMGMGAHYMTVPEELADAGVDRAEMVICLPPDWNITGKDEKDYWPIRWLKILARLPGEQDTWLGWGHTVPSNGPFAENTGLCGIMLVTPGAFGPAAATCILPNGEEINFYQAIPVYEEEMEFKIAHGADALLEKINKKYLEVVDIHRSNTCTVGQKKRYLLSKEDIRPILNGWEGPEGCLATDRITVEGRKIGYMYREKPAEEYPDSGWRFLAGDESGDYLDDPDHTAVYALNTICNYDPEIIPLLKAPYGVAYSRGADGKFHLEHFNLDEEEEEKPGLTH